MKKMKRIKSKREKKTGLRKKLKKKADHEWDEKEADDVGRKWQRNK